MTYNKMNNKARKTRRAESLSHIIFEILGSLAEESIAMPEEVWLHLKSAIYFRKRVGRFYRSLPEVGEAYLRHEWLVQRLEDLATAFGLIRNIRDGEDDEGEVENVATVREGFEVLALSDDEEEPEHEEKGEPTVQAYRIILEQPPTPEELELEERQFAIALFLCELDSMRKSLRRRWTKWEQQTPRDDAEAAQNLLAITSSTEYALSAVSKSFLQMSMEIDASSDIDEIIQVVGESASKSKELTRSDFEEGDLVVIHSLETRPELNGSHGCICKAVDRETSEGLAVQTNNKQVLVHPKNLSLSDDTFQRICQIHSVMGSLNLNEMDIPEPPELVYGAPASHPVIQAGINLITNADSFDAAARNQDFDTMLQFTVKYCLPYLISITRYLPNVGAADAVLIAYIRDYSEKGVLKFPLAFAMLVAIDGATICACREGGDKGLATKDVFVRELKKATTPQLYMAAIRLLEGDGKRTKAFYSHFDFITHMTGEYSVAGVIFPLLTGELMLCGLRMHVVCGCGLPFAYPEKYLHVLHIYWVLRSEGHMGKIPELESVIGMYNQQVFFRGGLAKKGQKAYAKCQQMALGVRIEAMRYLDGRGSSKRGPMAFSSPTFEGLHVTEISRLLDILQWKSMPILDKEACLDEIEKIAKVEYSSILVAPVMSVSVKVMQLANNLERGFAGVARQSGPKMTASFSSFTARMSPLDVVSIWVMSLGDDRSVVPGEKGAMLSQIADLYSNAFGGMVEPVSPGEEPSLTFSENNHKVDPALWGQQGAKKLEHLHV